MKLNFFRVAIILAVYGLLSSATAAQVAAQTAAQAGEPHLMLTRAGYEQRAAAARAAHAPAVSNLLYHGGPVMHTLAAHTIFWDPNNNIPAAYMNLVNRWFQDIGGSTFYGIMRQYYDNPGPVYIQNVSTYGGTWHDTTNAYSPRTGTAADPLSDADIQAEVSRALTANGWPTGLGDMYFVYTEKGIESCSNSTHCTPGTAYPVYCAYHNHYLSSGVNVIYANQPYAETWGPDCRNFIVSPNGNFDADSVISITSHEQFEAVTDPLLNAWYDGSGNENCDKCAYYEGALASAGSNHNFNGHPYITQLEWSNAVSGCDQLYLAPPVKSVFLPLILKPGVAPTSLGLHGHVTVAGVNAPGVPLNLMFFDGSFTSVYTTGSTNVNGIYSFTGLPSLAFGEDYWVTFGPNTTDTTRLNNWRTRFLNYYAAGTDIKLGDFDLANIALSAPANAATVPLPQTFSWNVRSATPTDSYIFVLFNPGFSSPFYKTDPQLGDTGSYNLLKGPPGFAASTQYGWTVRVMNPDNGLGGAYFYRTVTFSNVTAPSGAPDAGLTGDPALEGGVGAGPKAELGN